MKVLAIPATNSVGGKNHRLLRHVAQLISEQVADVELTFVDLNEFELPIYSSVREDEGGVPDLARQFFELIGDSDAVVVSYAEYNGSFTPAWKNTFDWASRIDKGVFQDRPVLMLAAAPGPRAGAGVLGSATMTGPSLGANLIGSLGIGSFESNFDDQHGVVDAELDAELRTLIGQLLDAIE